jgi:hypothetical protein
MMEVEQGIWYVTKPAPKYSMVALNQKCSLKLDLLFTKWKFDYESVTLSESHFMLFIESALQYFKFFKFYKKYHILKLF